MNQFRAMIHGMIWLGGGGLVIMAAALAAPAVESKYFPVVEYTQVEIAGRGADQVVVQITGRKIRACRLEEFSTLILDTDGVWKRAEVTVDNAPIQMRARVQGWQSFGTWRMKPAGVRVRFTAWHDCHGLWTTYTSLGEWVLP